MLERSGRVGDLKGIELAPSERSSHRVSVGENESWYFAPGAATAFSILDRSAPDAVYLLTQLHRGKFWGTPGRALFSGVAFFCVLLVFTGCFLFQGRRRSSSARGVHRWVGGIIALPLTLLCLTGGIWNFSSEFRSLAPSEKAAAKALANGTARTLWEEAFDSAVASYGESPVSGVYRVSGRILVTFEDSSRFYWDLSGPVQGFHLHRSWKASGWFEPLFALHSGRSFGFWGTWIPVVLGVFTMVIVGTGGCLLWATRRRREQVSTRLTVGTGAHFSTP